MSRHCTSGRPASIITENWRVKMARFFGGDLLADLAGFALAAAVGLRPSPASIRVTMDLLAAQRRDRRRPSCRRRARR